MQCVVVADGRRSMGYVLSCNGWYVITCYHTVLDCMEVDVYFPESEKKTLHVYNVIREYDIAILSFIGKTPIKTDMYEGDESRIKYLSLIGDKMVTEFIDVLSVEIVETHLVSLLMPTITMVATSIRSSQIGGLSGGLVYHKGPNMIFKIRGDKIMSVPITVIKLIISAGISRRGLRGVMIHTNMCTIREGDDVKTGLFVVEDTCSYPNGKKMFAFKEGDIILKVDNNPVNSDGLIFQDNVGRNVSLNTSLLFNFCIRKELNIAYIRNNTQKHINIGGIRYNDMFTVRLYAVKTHTVAGFIFQDLSEDLVIKLGRAGIKLNLPRFNTFNRKGRRPVILVGTDSTQMSTDNIALCSRYNIAYHRSDKPQHPFLLEKIGNRIVNASDNIKTAETFTLLHGDETIKIEITDI